jgi:sec-independent protein translocase protein TatC
MAERKPWGGIFGRHEREMPFWEHLEELRRRLLRAIGAMLVLTIAAYLYSGTILDWLVVRTIGEATFLKPLEVFNTRLKVSFLVALIAGAPYILWEIWGFMVPGLMQREKKIVGPLVFWSALLFYGGVAFAYFVVNPMMLRMLVGFETEHIRPQIAVSSLLDFMTGMALASGILFQLPLVVAALSIVGVLHPSFLIRRWRHAFVGIFVLTAVITPGDGPSQVILAAPVLVLYFASILIARAIWRGRKHGGPEGSATPGEKPTPATPVSGPGPPVPGGGSEERRT